MGNVGPSIYGAWATTGTKSEDTFDPVAQFIYLFIS